MEHFRKIKFWGKNKARLDSSTSETEYLKDFLYLDFERVRSFVAQFYLGLPESRVLAKGRKENKKASIGWEPIAGASASVLTEKGSSETQSLHLAMYDIFENEAKKQGFIDEGLGSARISKIDCQIRIVDYGEMADKVGMLSKLLPSLNRIQTQTVQMNKVDRNKQKNEEKQQTAEFENIQQIVDTIFGNTIYGIGYVDDKQILDMKLQKDILQLKTSGLIDDSGEVLTEKWTVVGMVIQKQSKPILDKSNEGENPVADAIYSMNSAFDDIKGQIMPRNENLTELVPIAIYRKIEKKKH